LLPIDAVQGTGKSAPGRGGGEGGPRALKRSPRIRLHSRAAHEGKGKKKQKVNTRTVPRKFTKGKKKNQARPWPLRAFPSLFF